MIDFFWLEWVRGDLVFHCHDGVRSWKAPFKPYCYVDGAGSGSRNMAGSPVRVKEFATPAQCKQYGQQNVAYESDIPYEMRALVDNGWSIGTVPKAYLDIETVSAGKIDMQKNPIISIAILKQSEGEWQEHFLTGDEERMLRDAVDVLSDVGLVMTWNGGEGVWETRSFDVPYMAHRWAYVVERSDKDAIFRFAKRVKHIAFRDLYRRYRAEMALIRKTVYGGYGLGNVAKLELDESKVEIDKPIHELSHEQLREYNMQDVRLLQHLDSKYGFAELDIAKARAAHVPLVRWTGKEQINMLTPLNLLDGLLLTEARKRRLVLPDIVYGRKHETIEGAIVMTPRVGLWKHVQNYDVKQMYPSIMINERISPDRDRVLIPGVLRGLMEQRAVYKSKYKETGASEHNVQQMTYKILSNIVYGAFASPMCRVYDSRLAAKVTDRGRRLVQQLKEEVEAVGCTALYADTDSTFCVVDPDQVDAICDHINQRISPYVVEAGEYYSHMLFVAKGGEGAKKQYAGLCDGQLKVTGLGAVRNDFCDVVRQAQRKVLEMLLGGKGVLGCWEYLHGVKVEIMSGKVDEGLVLRKKVKRLEEYSSKGTLPPQAKALQQVKEATGTEPLEVEYVYCQDGPQAILQGKMPKRVDYKRYWEQVLTSVKPLMDSASFATLG